ncbi:MAG TPA: S9 family peptidase [Allosphingosinicella sp.]|nr:S9 family peptidase [Allosphingosinicella sp.]
MISSLFAFLITALQPAEAPMPDPAIAFGARENVEFIALSPDGRRIAYAVPREGQGSRLLTLDVGATQPRQVITVDGASQRLSGCNWVSNARLVCTLYGVADRAGVILTGTRLVAFNLDGSDVRVLGQRDSAYQAGLRTWGGNVVDWLAGQEDQVLMAQSFIPEARSGSLIVRDEEGVGVVQVDTGSGRSRRVEPPSPGAFRYLSDGQGRIRIKGVEQIRGATEMAGQVITHFYRRAGSDEWVRLGEYNSLTGQGPWPLAIDGPTDKVYILESIDGRDQIYRMALDGSNRRDLNVAHPHVDVDTVLRLGRRGRVVGATYATERRQSVYFDPDLQRIAAQLASALPETPLINFVGASDDERKLLIWAGSDSDPGTYYLFDRESRNLTRIMRSRPELDGVALASMRPITFRAADGTEIPAYLTLPPGSDGRGLPALVMPHGGPGARDEWGFDWLAQFFANRGFAVLQPNFRGSAGYGDEWFQANGFQSWRTAIGDVNDAGRWLVAEGIADASKLGILGWSYGGYAALQSGVIEPELFRAVVAIAPVADLQEWQNEWRRFTNAANIRDFIGSGQHLTAGSPARNAASIRAPVLLFHGELDRNVGVAQSRLMRDRLRDSGKQVELVEFEGLDHQLEDSAARVQMLRQSDAFFRRTLAVP